MGISKEAAQASYKEKIAQRLKKLKGSGPQQQEAGLRDAPAGNRHRQHKEERHQARPEKSKFRGLLPRPKAMQKESPPDKATKKVDPTGQGTVNKYHRMLAPASVAIKQIIAVSVDVYTPAIARRLSDFTLGPVIGMGPYSQVKRAIHIHSDRVCALKCVSKSAILKARQVEHLVQERQVMMAVNECPFAVELHTTMQDDDAVYLVMEYVPGGELFTHLQAAGRFQEDTARFYAAQVLLLLEHMHKRDMVYRDLKLENIMLDAKGNVKVIDFGLAKHVGPLNRTFTFCGTPDYLAPEIVLSKGHGKAADYWALGVLIFEMIAGYPPFFHNDTLESYKKITEGKVFFPSHVSHPARSLVRGLLQVDLTKRLGNMCNGAWDIKNHQWFHGIDWVGVFRKELTPPIEIWLESELDQTYCTVYDKAPALPKEPVSKENQTRFSDF